MMDAEVKYKICNERNASSAILTFNSSRSILMYNNETLSEPTWWEGSIQRRQCKSMARLVTIDTCERKRGIAANVFGRFQDENNASKNDGFCHIHLHTKSIVKYRYDDTSKRTSDPPSFDPTPKPAPPPSSVISGYLQAAFDFAYKIQFSHHIRPLQIHWDVQFCIQECCFYVKHFASPSFVVVV